MNHFGHFILAIVYILIVNQDTIFIYNMMVGAL